MRYVNPHKHKVYRSTVHFLLWLLGYYNDAMIPQPIPDNFTYPNSEEAFNLKSPLVTWVNHSTFWVRAFDQSLLFDPIWNERCSPFSFFGPKRCHPPLPALDAITHLDTVIISHNHYDHLDKYTIKYLSTKYPQVLWVVPLGLKKWFYRNFPKLQVEELAWWGSIKRPNFKITSVPAQHYSGRGLFDRNKTHWMGCVVEFDEGKRLYFAGDTGYNPFDFKEIKKNFPRMDLSLIPIGVYKPRAFMKPVHVNPFESVQIHSEIGSKLSIASHWGTFKLSSEEMKRPPYDLYCALERSKISFSAFRVLNPGQSINW